MIDSRRGQSYCPWALASLLCLYALLCTSGDSNAQDGPASVYEAGSSSVPPLEPKRDTGVDRSPSAAAAPVACAPEAARQYEPYVQEAARLYQLPEAYLWATMEIRSGFNEKSVANDGGLGLFRLTPSLAEDMGVTNAFNVRQNILGGARSIRIAANAAGGDLVLATATAFEAYMAWTRRLDRASALLRSNRLSPDVRTRLAATVAELRAKFPRAAAGNEFRLADEELARAKAEIPLTVAPYVEDVLRVYRRYITCSFEAAPLVQNPSLGLSLPSRSKGKFSSPRLYKTLSKSVFMVISDKGTGSAVAVTENHLFTNAHVAGGFRDVVAIVRGSETRRAYVVSVHAGTDQSILFVPEGGLIPVRGTRHFDDIEIGEDAFCLGYPAAGETFSSGMISAKPQLAVGMRYLQTTAPVSPGSSGGGLFDKAGNLLGIVRASLKEAQNINVAIPVGDFSR